MTMDGDVVRRFDVQVEKPRVLADVMDSLRARAGQMRTRPELKQVGTSLLEVRLEGSAATVSTAVDEVAAKPGVRIYHDRVRLAMTAQYGDAGDGEGRGPAPTNRPGDSGRGTPTVVAVVDSGIMVTHPDLEGHLWRGTVDGRYREFGARCIGGGEPGPDVTDQDGHGTRLAGTILAAARGAPGVQLMAVKFFDADALPGPANGTAAIEFARKAGAHIINLSWDLGIGSPALEQAVEEAARNGALIVIAAGNSGADNDVTPTFPAFYRESCRDRIITVMATDRYNEKASFSNYGAKTVDLAAPGVDRLTTRASLSNASRVELERYPFYRRYRSYNGTSAAAAFVSGAAARLKSEYPDLTADQLKGGLIESARETPGLKSKCVTGRLLDRAP
jgi:subtilisin family serine protease